MTPIHMRRGNFGLQLVGIRSIGFVEKAYENALVFCTRKTGLLVEQQYPIKVTFEGVIVGEFFADLLVEKRVLVELKAVSMLNQEHTAQALNYLRATGVEVCLLINCPFAENKMTFFNFLPVVYKRQPINQVIPKYEFVK